MAMNAGDNEFDFDGTENADVTIPSLTLEDVKKAIVESVGDMHTIAMRLHVDRVALRRYINSHPEAKEAIEDEILSSRERVMKKTYDDAMNGSQQARSDFFRMTGGMFDKKEDKAAESQKLIIQFSEPKKKFKVLDDATGEITYVDDKLRQIEGGADDDADDEEEVEDYSSDEAEDEGEEEASETSEASETR